MLYVVEFIVQDVGNGFGEMKLSDTVHTVETVSEQNHIAFIQKRGISKLRYGH